MGFAHEFFKDQHRLNMSFEDKLIFIINNYNTCMDYYRVVQKQVIENERTKVQAHRDLNDLRNHLEHLKQTQYQFTETEKISFKEKEKYLEELREKSFPIYYKKEELTENEITMILKEFPLMFRIIDHFDIKIRPSIGKFSKWFYSKMIIPALKCLDIFEYHRPNSSFIDITRDSILSVPDLVSNKWNVNVINLSDHIPEPETE
jgi:hypothetical protein